VAMVEPLVVAVLLVELEVEVVPLVAVVVAAGLMMHAAREVIIVALLAGQVAAAALVSLSSSEEAVDHTRRKPSIVTSGQGVGNSIT